MDGAGNFYYPRQTSLIQKKFVYGDIRMKNYDLIKKRIEKTYLNKSIKSSHKKLPSQIEKSMVNCVETLGKSVVFQKKFEAKHKSQGTLTYYYDFYASRQSSPEDKSLNQSTSSIFGWLSKAKNI